MKTAIHEDLEEVLLLWTKGALARNVFLSGPILAIKTKELTLLLNTKNFNCNEDS